MSSGRGECQTCGSDYALTWTGLVRKHWFAGSRCPGSGKPPLGRGELSAVERKKTGVPDEGE